MEEKRIYYKVLDEDMYAPYINFKYELNKTYTIDDGLCEDYFHACKNMYELIIWCGFFNNIKECRFFKCYLGDITIEYPHKVVSNSITLIEEIPFEVIDKEIRNNIGLLTNDEDPIVRTAVAEQGYGLETLVNDKFCPINNIKLEKMESELMDTLEFKKEIINTINNDKELKHAYATNKLFNNYIDCIINAEDCPKAVVSAAFDIVSILDEILMAVEPDKFNKVINRLSAIAFNND